MQTQARSPQLSRQQKIDGGVRRAYERLEKHLEERGKATLAVRMGTEVLLPYMPIFSKMLAEELKEVDKPSLEEVKQALSKINSKIARHIDLRIVWTSFGEEHTRGRITQEVERFKPSTERVKSPEMLFVDKAVKLAREGRWENVRKGFENALRKKRFTAPQLINLLEEVWGIAGKDNSEEKATYWEIRELIQEEGLKTLLNDASFALAKRDVLLFEESIDELKKMLSKSGGIKFIEILLNHGWKFGGNSRKAFLARLEQEVKELINLREEYVREVEGYQHYAVYDWRDVCSALFKLAVWGFVPFKQLKKALEEDVKKVRSLAKFRKEEEKSMIESAIKEMEELLDEIKAVEKSVELKRKVEERVRKALEHLSEEELTTYVDKGWVLNNVENADLSKFQPPEERLEELKAYVEAVERAVQEGNAEELQRQLSRAEGFKLLVAEELLDDLDREVSAKKAVSEKRGSAFPEAEMYGALYEFSLKLMSKALEEALEREEGLFFNRLVLFTIKKAGKFSSRAGKGINGSCDFDVLKSMKEWRKRAIVSIVSILNKEGKLKGEVKGRAVEELKKYLAT